MPNRYAADKDAKLVEIHDKEKNRATLPQGTKWSISWHTPDLSPIHIDELMPRKVVDIPLSFEKKMKESKHQKRGYKVQIFVLKLRISHS
jgi:hypothetical protein